MFDINKKFVRIFGIVLIVLSVVFIYLGNRIFIM